MMSKAEVNDWAKKVLLDLENAIASSQMSYGAALAWAFLRGSEYQTRMVEIHESEKRKETR